MKIKATFSILIIAILLSSCAKQQARKPVSQTSGSFIEESILRNKTLIANEEKLIDLIISKDTLKQYVASSKGYWYKYDFKNVNDSLFPKKGDVAFFDYEISDLKNNVIYTKEELKAQTYYVDRQDIMMGLRDGIKLMKKGETVTFLFPSHMAFGYHGDNNKISENEPLICKVTLNNFTEDTTTTKLN